MWTGWGGGKKTRVLVGTAWKKTLEVFSGKKGQAPNLRTRKPEQKELVDSDPREKKSKGGKVGGHAGTRSSEVKKKRGRGGHEVSRGPLKGKG